MKLARLRRRKRVDCTQVIHRAWHWWALFNQQIGSKLSSFYEKLRGFVGLLDGEASDGKVAINIHRIELLSAIKAEDWLEAAEHGKIIFGKECGWVPFRGRGQGHRCSLVFQCAGQFNI